MGKQSKLQIEYRDPEELQPYEKNAKLHPPKQIRQIAESIKRFGFKDPIGIASDTKEIIEGHGRLKAVLEDEDLRKRYKQIPTYDFLKHGSTIIWNKESIGLKYRNYRSTHEMILYADDKETEFHGTHDKAKDPKYKSEYEIILYSRDETSPWYGDHAQSDVWTFHRE